MTTQPAGVIPVLTRGQRLTIAMEYAGLRPEDMAIKLRCSASTIRNYLGERTQITWPTLCLWADVTGVDLSWLDSGSAAGPDGGRGMDVSASFRTPPRRHLSAVAS